MSKKLIDQHEFTLWRYDDDSVDIQCYRTDDDTIEELAYLEACVLARSLGEEINQAEEVFCIRAYQTGGASTQWRDQYGSLDDWKGFKWLKRSLHQASYGSLVELQEPPGFLLRLFWAVEFGLAKLATRWAKSKAEQKSCPVEEPEPAAAPVHKELPDNVLLFRPK